MIRRCALATVLLLSLLLTNGNCQDAADKNFKTECFKETNESDVVVCEDSRINIKGTFYKCESALYLKSLIKRIGFLHDEVLVLAGRQNFHIEANTSNIRPVRRIAPLITQLSDKKGNIYYGGNNVVYIKRDMDNEYLEVTTHDVQENYNHIALDEINNNLFILSHYEDENTSTLRSSLFIVPTSIIDTSNDNIKAEEVTELKDISSIGYNPSNNFLYFGLPTPNGEGKLVKVRGQTNDPCAANENIKQDIKKAVSDFQDKLIDVIDKSTTNVQSRITSEEEDEKVLALTWVNEELTRQLNSTMIQLEALKSRIYNPPRFSQYSPMYPDNTDDFPSGGIEERMGFTPTKLQNGYSVNIMISPPQVVSLPANLSSFPNIILYPQISISVDPAGKQTPNNINSPIDYFSQNTTLLNSTAFNALVQNPPDKTNAASASNGVAQGSLNGTGSDVPL